MIKHKDHKEYIFIDDRSAKKQKNSEARSTIKVINGAKHLKNMGCTQNINKYEITKKTTIFIASWCLYFSQPKAIPPITIPIKAKDKPHKKYIKPIDMAERGNMYSNSTLSELPPIIQLTSPRHSVTAPIIIDGLALNILISWVILSKNLFNFFIIFKKILTSERKYI